VITILGRLSALIEVGSGFHPELTGRENIFLSGSILGMRRREIADKLERIIDFAGVHGFIDTPVKHYSSGMYVRLGFSIAAHLEPDILLLDEVLAVGDADFQGKCLDRIDEMHREGRTIVMISHDLAAIERLCHRVLLFDRGRIAASGSAREVIAKYQTMAFSQARAERDEDDALSRDAEIVAVTCCGEDGRPATAFATGAPVTVRLQYVTHRPVSCAVFEVYFLAVIGGAFVPWCQLTTASISNQGTALEPGPGTVQFDVRHLSLKPGMYYVSATIMDHRTPGTAIDRLHRCLTLRIDQGQFVQGSFFMAHQWRQLSSGS
jgi:ABC-type Na+ transport system ATPase subunit NatA